MSADQLEQLAQSMQIATIHPVVVKHDPERNVGLNPSRDHAREIDRCKPRAARHGIAPVDRDRKLDESGKPQRIAVDVARQRAEAKLKQAPTGRLQAVIPRRREDWLRKIVQHLREPITSLGEVGNLHGACSRWTELALDRTGFMVAV